MLIGRGQYVSELTQKYSQLDIEFVLVAAQLLYIQAGHIVQRVDLVGLVSKDRHKGS